MIIIKRDQDRLYKQSRSFFTFERIYFGFSSASAVRPPLFGRVSILLDEQFIKM